MTTIQEYPPPIDIWAMVPTPFSDTDASIDVGSLTALSVELVARGCTGMIALGVIAEPATLTTDERRTVLETITAAVPLTPLYAAVNASDDRSRAAEAKTYVDILGSQLNAIMISVTSAAPTEFRQSLLSLHRASQRPIVIQDYPAATGISITVPNLLSAIEGLPFVTAIKCEAAPTFWRIHELHTATDVSLIAGLGGISLIDELRCGADAVACGITRPEVIARAIDLWRRGDRTRAQSEIARLGSLINFETQQRSSIGIRKEHWRRQGVIASNRVRAPNWPYPRFLTESTLAHGF